VAKSLLATTTPFRCRHSNRAEHNSPAKRGSVESEADDEGSGTLSSVCGSTFIEQRTGCQTSSEQSIWLNPKQQADAGSTTRESALDESTTWSSSRQLSNGSAAGANIRKTDVVEEADGAPGPLVGRCAAFFDGTPLNTV